MTGLAFYPLLPWWLILPGVAVGGWLCWRACQRGVASIGRRQRRQLLALRWAALAVVTVMLLCPGRVVTDRNPQRANVVVLLDRSASMGTADLPNGRTRLAEAVDFLADNPIAAADYPVHRYLFADDATPVKETPADLEAAGGTDLRQAVDRVDRDLGLAQVAAVVLVSDGIDHSDFRAAELTAPIFSVAIGTDLANSRDLAIGAFDCPDRISAREELNLDVPLTLSGFPRPHNVRFTATVDGEPLVDDTVEVVPGRPSQQALTLYFDSEGVHILHLETARLEDEASYLNNEREIAIEVVKARTAVAAYFPLLTTDFRPLLRELERQPDSTFTAVYRVAGDQFRQRGTAVDDRFATGIPARAAALRPLTCFILAAHNTGRVSVAEAAVLEDYVREGGSLILLGGPDSFGDLPPGSPLERLSPVRHLRDGFTAGDFTVVVPDGASGAFADQLRELIAANPPGPDFVLRSLNRVQEVKNGARVLLDARDGSRQPLVVLRPWGKGKVVAVLSNGLHLWGATERREQNYGIFWRQLIALCRSVSDEAELLKVTVNRAELPAGDTLDVSAVASPPVDGNEAALTVTAELTARTAEAEPRRLDMRRRGEAWTAAFDQLAPGDYVLKVTSVAGAEVVRERYRLIRVGDPAGEHARLAVDREAFRRWSATGHVYDSADGDRLREDLRRVLRRHDVRREQFVIFETPWFLALLALLLVAEWTLRRRWNLF